jgi:tetratricopeptide (TPR) repeat protein
LRNEAAARRDAEDEYAMLRASMSHSILNSSPLYGPADADQIREEFLREADLSLNRLLERQPGDVQLRAQRARVLTQLGAIHLSQSRHDESVAAFEKAADLWEQLRDTEPRNPSNLAWRATAYAGLEQAHDRTGRQEPAQRYFEAAVRIWQEIIKYERNARFREALFPAVVNVRWVLVGPGIDWGDVSRRFKRIRERVDRMGGGEEAAFIYDSLRLGYLWHLGGLNVQSGYKEKLLAVARESDVVLSGHLSSASLDRRYRAVSASQSLQVCLWMRRAGAPDEALRLGVRANGTLRELVRGDPDNHPLLAYLSSSWYEIGKINWDLHRVEESLTACRNAVEVQGRLFELAPAVVQNRELLGARHMQLGRKLCELGRLDEAEACFANRQALWPHDSRKHDEALRELRKWAEEVGEAQNDWPAAPPQQRHRYLELCSRLERKGAATISPTGIK